MPTNISKLNKRNMIIMGFIGLFLGIIVSTGIMVSTIGPGQEPNKLLMILITIVATVLLGFAGSRMKVVIPQDKKLLNQEKLSQKEKTYIWIFSLINPVITGAVTYYMYNKDYPAKARQSNIISFITFIPWFIVVLYLRGMIKL